MGQQQVVTVTGSFSFTLTDDEWDRVRDGDEVPWALLAPLFTDWVRGDGADVFEVEAVTVATETWDDDPNGAHAPAERALSEGDDAPDGSQGTGDDRPSATDVGGDSRYTCAACGYVASEEGVSSSDNAHDNLCCGGARTCWDLLRDGRPCCTHQDAAQMVKAAVA